MGERAWVVVDVLMRASWAERRERVGRRWVRRRMEEVVMVLFLLAWVRLYGFRSGVLRHGCRMLFARPKCELWVVRHADAQDVHVQSLAPKIPIDTLKKIFLYGFLC